MAVTRKVRETATGGRSRGRRDRLRARDLVLFVHAMRLARAAQRLARGITLPETVLHLTSLAALPRAVAASEADRAATRACARLARWTGALDSCLIRSLVMGALLSDRPRVRLHLGVRRAGDPVDPLHAHAWVSEAERVVSTAGPTPARGVPFAEIVALDMKRPIA